MKRHSEEALARAATLAPEIRRRLLRAYDEGKRDLPWRGETDPYRIWVSEIMLQQTRVETVIPYYNAWLARFPDLESLAEAGEEEVLRLWQGLGYYSRARNLHKGAQVVRERFRGNVPEDPAELRSLPGVGEYTAGALASIAFGVAAPAVDGNVRRVLCRVFDLPEPGPAQLRELAAALVDPDRPGDFNQALMELGALVCTPRSPECAGCPIRGRCAALAAGTVEERPTRKVRKPVPEVDVAVLVAVVRAPGATGEALVQNQAEAAETMGGARDGPRNVASAPGGAGDGHGAGRGLRFLLRRRPEKGLLAGMWEFPGVEWVGSVAPGSGVSAESHGSGLSSGGPAGGAGGEVVLGLARELGLEPGSVPVPLPRVSHAFTHLKAAYWPFLVEVTESGHGVDVDGEVLEGGGGAGLRACRWVSPGEMAGLPVSVAQEKIFRLALEGLKGV